MWSSDFGQWKTGSAGWDFWKKVAQEIGENLFTPTLCLEVFSWPWTLERGTQRKGSGAARDWTLELLNICNMCGREPEKSCCGGKKPQNSGESAMQFIDKDCTAHNRAHFPLATESRCCGSESWMRCQRACSAGRQSGSRLASKDGSHYAGNLRHSVSRKDKDQILK